MKKTRRLFLGAVILASGAVSSSLVRGAGVKTFEGEIADSQCALGVHSLNQSHKEMIDMGSAGKTPADCARYCVRERGGRFVLQSKQAVYKLDNQELAEKSAGMKVKVTGTVDPKTNTIQVRTIEPITSK
jgi:type 1 fimbria pilin